jgi:hypothetical protein
MNEANKTKRGTPLVLTGRVKTVGNDVYREAQMLPVHPQRLEWVNEKNLRKD